MTPTLTAALALAKRGLPVFRLARGSKSHFVDKDWATGGATADLLTVWDHFSVGDYNIGVLANGLVVLDVDAGKGGLEALPDLGALPDTFAVKTVRGGYHYYFRAPEGSQFGNTIEKLGPGLDTRGLNGYVVGPGSEGYTVVCDAPIADLPPTLASRLNLAPAPRASELGVAVAGPQDALDAIAAATRYLQSDAAGAAVEGAGGDARTYKTACRVLDFGLTPGAAFDLMAEHYNPKCSPPWPLDELQAKIENAAQYRQAPIGRDNPAAGFSAAMLPLPVNAFGLRVRKFEQTAETVKGIPLRPWLARQRLVRGKLSSLVAPGSIGKSLLTLQWACAVALGPADPLSAFCGLDVVEQSNVLIINNEDEHDELDRRLAAVVSHFELPWSDLRHRIHMYSGQNDPTFMVAVRAGKGALAETEAVNECIDYLKANKIGFVVADPLVDTHEAEENSNSEMARVMRVWKRIAIEANAAVLLVHHSRKTQNASSDGHAGSADAGRGAGAVVNAARLNFTFFNMSEKDAEALGVAPETKHRFVRLDDSKINLGLASPAAAWFERVTVKLANGESLGVLETVELSPVKADDPATFAAILAPVITKDGPQRLKTAAAIVAADPLFSGVSAASLAKRLHAAFKSGFGFETPLGVLKFTADGKNGGAFSI